VPPQLGQRASGRPSQLDRPPAELEHLGVAARQRVQGRAGPDGVEFRIGIGASGCPGERALRPTGGLVQGTELDQRTGQLRLDPGAQIRRNVVA